MKNKIRVVFDTNVFLSAILFGGNCRTLLDLARRAEIRIFVSPFILKEIKRKLEEKFNWSEAETKEVLAGILFFAKVVRPKAQLHKIKGDESDNRILEAAVAAKASYLISGDQRHLIPLKTFRRTKIVSPSQFLKNLFSEN